MRHHHQSRTIVLLAVVSCVALVFCCGPGAAVAGDPPDGFVSLFNGKDLSGWVGSAGGGDPRKFSAMAPAGRTAARAKATQSMRGHWRIDGDEIVNDGGGPYLETERDYGDFELLIDWKIVPKGDSGIYLRGVPQVQIWDPVAGIPAAKVGSGGLYNNQKNPSKPLVCADKPTGEWNTFRIRLIGDNTTVWLNDQLVVNEIPLENYWERKRPLYPSGPISIQTHGGELRIRNVFIKEIPRVPPESGVLHRKTGQPVGPGWEPLVSDATPGEMDEDVWQMEAGELRGRASASGQGGFAYADGDYGDFEIHAKVRVSGSSVDSALCIRVDPSASGSKGGAAAGPITVGAGGEIRIALGGDGARAGEWSHVYAIARGTTVEVWRDGKPAGTALLPRARKSGAIGIELGSGEAQGFELALKDAYVRPLSENPAMSFMAPRPGEAGFVTLFNGKDLTGWIHAIKGYRAEDGKLVCMKRGGGNLYTAKQYSDFVFRFEFKLESGANNGVGIRARYEPATVATRAKTFDAAYHGMEIQVLENTHSMYTGIRPYQAHGSVYDIQPALRGYQRPVGQWNYEEIRAKGSQVTVTLNGKVIADIDLSTVTDPGILKRHANGIRRTEGYIGFLGHGHRIEFRNIRVKEL